MHTIAIDCGASFIKAALISDGEIRKKMEKPAPLPCSMKEIFHPRQIYELVTLVRRMIAELAEGCEEIRLCISNEMHGFLLATEKGLPYTDYISWQKELGNVKNSAGLSPLQLLKREEFRENIRHTGMPLRAGLPSCNLLYLTLNDFWDGAPPCLYFYTLGDFLIKSILRQEPTCHPTNAAATGLYNLKTANWDNELIHFVSGKQTILFPAIAEGGTISGNSDGIIIHACSAIGDQQAALLGCGLAHMDEISYNLGTGAQVSRIVKDLDFSPTWQIRPYFDGLYIKTIPHLPSGRALNVFFRFWAGFAREMNPFITDSEIWDILLKLEREAPGSALQCDLSFFENAVTDHQTGSILNIEENSFQVGNLMKAILKQMAVNFTGAADKIYPDKSKINTLLFSGGISRKIESLREAITRHYDADKNLAVQISVDETLKGLFFFSQYLNHKGD